MNVPARVVLTACLLSLLAGCSWLQTSAAIEREALITELSWDPAVELASIGSAESSEDALAMAEVLREPLTGQQELRVLRYGLGHHDERVVFGAVVMMAPYDRLIVPELRNAARIAIPRLGCADCPLTNNMVRPLVGSGDFDALVDVFPRLTDEQADYFLGALHRMVRPDAIAPLCRIARNSEGELRQDALGNASLVACYSGEGTELLARTFVELAGGTVEEHAANDGLPPLLRAALRVIVERDGITMPSVACARWLVASTPAEGDLPLLVDLMLEHVALREAAVWALGSMGDDASLALLATEPPGCVFRSCWLASRARRGDAAALEQLLAGDDSELCFGLAVAPPARRREFLRELLRATPERAIEVLDTLRSWVSGELGSDWALPPYDDRYVAELEQLAFEDEALGVPFLRALVASVPVCESRRLADRLLAEPADELFQLAEEWYGVDSAVSCARCGVWAFLEVTRPEVFVQRLREGLSSKDAFVRDQCAELLVRMGDVERSEELIAWIDERAGPYTTLAMLARGGGVRLQKVLRARAVASGDDADYEALAVSLGMPLEHTELLMGDGRADAERASLLDGDAVSVMRQIVREQGFSTYRAASLFSWCDEVVVELQEWRRSGYADADSLARFDIAAALHSGDRDRIARALQPLVDGRYATHDAMPTESLVSCCGIEWLPFWVDQLGTNCCKVVTFEDVLVRLLGNRSEAFRQSEYREPASVFLRRTLLPVRHRLRYSRIVDAFVVAGE